MSQQIGQTLRHLQWKISFEFEVMVRIGTYGWYYNCALAGGRWAVGSWCWSKPATDSRTW